MEVEEAIRLATREDYTPTPHEQASVSYVLAKEIERLRLENERLRAVVCVGMSGEDVNRNLLLFLVNAVKGLAEHARYGRHSHDYVLEQLVTNADAISELTTEWFVERHRQQQEAAEAAKGEPQNE